MCSRFLEGLLALALLALPAAADPLRVCADPNNLPFSNAAGEGFENRIAELVAYDLGATLSYTWHAQRRGFLRETLKAGLCDVVIGMPVNIEGVRTTRPYYRSTYVFVTRADAPVPEGFDDPLLRAQRIGVQLIGDDGWNTPPAHALVQRGITQNVRGFPVYGDYREAVPLLPIIRAVAAGEIDVAIVWGPLGGYGASLARESLVVTPLPVVSDGPRLPMAWDIGMAVRREDEGLRHDLNAALRRLKPDIDRILSAYGVPRLDAPGPQAQVLP